MSPSISVILPVYNAGKYLDEALDSIWAQSRLPQEVIAVDDGSTDNSLDILKRYANRLVVISRENRGVSATLNQAIRLATSEFVTFLDADDYWTSNKLAQQATFLEQQPNQDACFGLIQQFISPELSDTVKQTIHCPSETQRGLIKGTLMIRRTIFQRVGWFDETLQRGDFIDWFVRAEEAGLQYTVLPVLFAYRRLHRSGLSSQQQHEKDLVRLAKLALDRRRAG